MIRGFIGFKNLPVLALNALFLAATYSPAISAQELEKQSVGRSFPDVSFFATPTETRDLPETPRSKVASFSDDQEHQESKVRPE